MQASMKENPRCETPQLVVSDSVILVSVHWPGRVRGGCAQPLALVMILAVWRLGARRLKGALARCWARAGCGALVGDGHEDGMAVITVSDRIP